MLHTTVHSDCQSFYHGAAQVNIQSHKYADNKQKVYASAADGKEWARDRNDVTW